MVRKQTTTAMPVRVRGAAAMSTYHLHAHILVGPLAAADRDEVCISETDSWDDARTWSREQLADGFTVWIYDHGHFPLISGASDYRVIAHERPVSIRSRQTPTLRRRCSPGAHQTPGRQAS